MDFETTRNRGFDTVKEATGLPYARLFNSIEGQIPANAAFERKGIFRRSDKFARGFTPGRRSNPLPSEMRNPARLPLSTPRGVESLIPETTSGKDTANGRPHPA